MKFFLSILKSLLSMCTSNVIDGVSLSGLWWCVFWFVGWLAYTLTLNVEAKSYFETTLNFYKNIFCHSSEYNNLQDYCCENLEGNTNFGLKFKSQM
jgi:hypothetical protein